MLKKEQIRGVHGNQQPLVKIQQLGEQGQSSSEFTNSNNIGFWGDSQNLKFAVFIDLNRSTFAKKENRKREKIFSQLAAYLKCRTPRQCRSHYQKFIEKHRTPSRMRTFYRKQAGIPEYEEELKRVKDYFSKIEEKEDSMKSQEHEVSLKDDIACKQSSISQKQEFVEQAYLHQSMNLLRNCSSMENSCYYFLYYLLPVSEGQNFYMQ